jgi:hypothetical protein
VSERHIQPWYERHRDKVLMFMLALGIYRYIYPGDDPTVPVIAGAIIVATTAIIWVEAIAVIIICSAVTALWGSLDKLGYVVNAKIQIVEMLVRAKPQADDNIPERMFAMMCLICIGIGCCVLKKWGQKEGR